MSEFMKMGPVAYAAYKQALRVDVWRGMMAGETKSWLAFFRMIESGESRILLREHVRYG